MLSQPRCHAVDAPVSSSAHPAKPPPKFTKYCAKSLLFNTPSGTVGSNRTVNVTTQDEGDIYTSLRKAAGCFKRQVVLLRSLDRFSTPVPVLEPEVCMFGICNDIIFLQV